MVFKTGMASKPLLRQKKIQHAVAHEVTFLCVQKISASPKSRGKKLEITLWVGDHRQTDRHRRNITGENSAAVILQRENIKHGNSNQHEE